MKKPVLIAARSEKVCETFSSALGENKVPAAIMTDAASIRFLDMNAFSAAFFFLPLSDENGLKLIPELCKKTDIPFAVIVNPGVSGKVIEKISAGNVFVLEKPFSRSDFLLSVQLLSMFREKNNLMREKINELEKRNEEIKLMCRAKLVLIETGKMSENDAHSYILHRAMDSQMSTEAVCKEIIGEKRKR